MGILSWNTEDPVPLVLDLHIVHNRFGSISDLNLNGHLHYPNDIDRSFNESVSDKIRKYRSTYNNNPPNGVSFMPPITSTSGRLHSEFVRLLFLHSNHMFSNVRGCDFHVFQLSMSKKVEKNWFPGVGVSLMCFYYQSKRLVNNLTPTETLLQYTH